MRQVDIRLTTERGGRRGKKLVFFSTGDATGAFTAAATATASFSSAGTVAETFTAAATGSAAFVGHLLITESFSAAATGTASFVAGAYRQITLPPSDPVPQSAAPTVTGGNPAMQLYIGAVNVSAYHKEELANIQSQTIGRWTANVELFDSSGTLLALFNSANGGVGLSITIQEYGFKLFAGCVQSVVAQRYLSTPGAFTFQITATDKSGICDRRVVKKKLYPSESDAADVIRDIVTNYLDGEGITTVGVPLTLGELGSDLPFNFQTVRNAFDQIATLTATIWWVDINGGLFFSALTDLPAAPFSLSETSRNWRGLSDSLGLQVTTTLQDYRNKQYEVSNLNIIPAPGSNAGPQVTETYVFGPNGQEAAFNAGLAFGYVLVNLPISTIVSLKINGVAKNAYSTLSPAAPPYGTNPTDWYFYLGAQVIYPSFAPSVGQTIEIVYVPQSTNVSTDEGEALVPVDPTLGMCGSGLYEAVDQVQDISFRDDLNAIAAAILAKAGGVPTEIQFQVIKHGLQPGQLLDVNIPLIGLTSRSFLITAVAGHSVGATMGDNCTFRWNVTARSNQDPGNWVKYFERIIRRTEQAKPIVQLETHAVINPTGALIISGVVFGNPIAIEQPGRLYAMRIAAASPPIDQDLVVTFTINGVPVGSITLADSAAANFFFVELFADNSPQYVYTNDALNATMTYTNIGASPVAARNVTATISHAI